MSQISYASVCSGVEAASLAWGMSRMGAGVLLRD